MTNLRILKCYVTVTSNLHLQAGLAHNCPSCIASSLPSGQRLMTRTKWLSHLTHYLAIHVSIIHQTIGGQLHKRASKVTRKLCAEWRQFIGRSKRQAVMALHVLHLTLIGKQRCVNTSLSFSNRWESCLLHLPEVWVLRGEHWVLVGLRGFQEAHVAHRAGVQGQQHLRGVH